MRFTSPHVNAPEHAGKPDANQERSQRDADCDFRGHADDNNLSAGRTVARRSPRTGRDFNRARRAYSYSHKKSVSSLKSLAWNVSRTGQNGRRFGHHSERAADEDLLRRGYRFIEERLQYVKSSAVLCRIDALQ